MASNQPTQAITVIKSDTINIPEPGSYLTGGNTGSGTTLTTAGAKFLGTFNAGNTGYSNRVAAGDVIYQGTTIVTVVSVDSDTQLTVSAALTGGGATYEIYRGNGGAQTQLPAGNEGFSLFVGTAGNLAVIPASSTDTVILKNVPDSSFIPLQVARVLSATTAADVVALR
tara:strand:+ start:16 stop:525 length:510 start_codon:yes stop_codon:yes gene_type:complete